ncbi:MAG: FHA domain-containing protein, partial [Polyangia bacterium]
MPRLTYYDFDKVEKQLDLGAEPVLIGRATECQIRTEDAVVSRRHARIVLDGGEYWIEDLGSMSGVFVGAEKVQRARMVPGEPAVMGSLVVFVMPEAAPATAPAADDGVAAAQLELARNEIAELRAHAEQLRTELTDTQTQVQVMYGELQAAQA